MKYLLYGSGFPRIFPAHKLNFVGHLSALSKWISQHRDLGFTSFPTTKFKYTNRTQLFQYVIDTELKDEAIDYLEFGVAGGDSFRWWAAHVKNPNAKFFGFDTFTGLPEDWGPFKAGDMSAGNEPPAMDDDRVSFYQGIFQQTLFDFLKNFDSNRKKIIHLDADLYTASLFVLTSMTPYLKEGDILLFDEFNVPLHEFKAFTEWVNSFYINYTVVGEINNYLQVAIRIEKQG